MCRKGNWPGAQLVVVCPIVLRPVSEHALGFSIEMSDSLASIGRLRVQKLDQQIGALDCKNTSVTAPEDPLQGLSTRNTLTPFRQSPHQVSGVR